MFYSEALLSKTGPLARVWLSANIERKVSKTHILQSSVKDSVDAIVNPSQAPMALRLSGQLLLGVVRIYSRKARYLLDDCNEALLKIKMAFRLSSNNDIPAGVHMPSRDALMLPDVLTEGDNLEMPPLPDASFLLSQIDETPSRKRRASSRDINLADEFGHSQYLRSSIVDKSNYADDELAFDDDLELGIDLGLGPQKEDMSVEFGRDAPAPRTLDEDIGDTDLNIFAKDGPSLTGNQRHSTNVGIADEDDDFRLVDDDGDIDLLGTDNLRIGDGPDTTLGAAAVLPQQRISESPLSDLDVSADLPAKNQLNLDSAAFEPIEDTEQSIMRKPAQRARKVKLLEADDKTMIPADVFKAQTKDHPEILRPQSFLPRDPTLLALMQMQKNGGFVSNIMKDGRSAGWAPEIRGMLSLDAITRSQDLKRKRDSGVADMDGEEDLAHKSPRLALDIDDESDMVIAIPDAGVDDAPTRDNTIIELEGGFQPQADDDEGYGRESVSRPASRDTESPHRNFDETIAPLVHPADNGPVSLGTKHAVHLLRDTFGDEAANSPNKRKNGSVLFQDLLPEAITSRADATKMFFEVLVLATKDAVKVEQKEGNLGASIRIRGKRGLWGAWAEREAGGEIAEEVEAQTAAPTVTAVES